MDKVKVYFNSTLGHFSQLYTGCAYLQKTGKINLRYVNEVSECPIDTLKMEYNGLVLFFDLSDNSKINKTVYNRSDFYIKRMLLKKDYEKYEKLIPFGLNYQVYYKNTYLKWSFLKNRKLLKYSLRYSKFFSTLLNIKDSVGTNHLSVMSSEPANRRAITFRARLWNPANNDTIWKKKERQVLNDQRIEINRLLKHEYPKNFKGGIQKDAFSTEKSPDLLLNKSEYHKKEYIKILKKSGIGIVNQGLEESISWKFGEYVAHSLAVITTPINKYQLLGPFTEGEHYLVYHDAEECLEMTRMLFNNDTIREKMQLANKNYYQEYLHPAQKLLKIFEIVQNKNSYLV